MVDGVDRDTMTPTTLAPAMKQKPDLKSVDGGRRELEAALLAEFAKPGVGNLRKVKKMANDLRPRGRLKIVPGAHEKADP